MSNKKAIVLGVPVLVLVAVAGQVISFKLAGNMLAGSFSYSSPQAYAVGGLSPTEMPDGEKAYGVHWQSCITSSDYEHRLCAWVSGVVPMSLVKAQQTESITLDLDISDLAYAGTGGEDCTTGTCVWFTPASLPLKGVLTAYSGLGSYSQRSTGTMERNEIYPFGMKTSSSFSGQRTEYSANFVGTVGQVTVSAPDIGANGSLSVSKGQQTVAQVYPSTP